MTVSGIINLGAGSLRIARPGRSALSSDPADFLLHDEFFFSQIIARGSAVVSPRGQLSINIGVDVTFNTHVAVLYGARGYFYLPVGFKLRRNTNMNTPSIQWSVSGSTLTLYYDWLYFLPGSPELSYIVFKV